MANPLVSVCVPTYNRAAQLREGLRSIQTQDYSPLEILISDNASEDETKAICLEAVRTDPRVHYNRQPINLGLYGNHNFCINASKGEFLCFFHDHDVRDPGLVSAYVSFFQRHPEVGVVCTDWELIDDQGRRLGVRRYGVRSVTSGLEYIGQTMRSGRSSIAVPGAMIRRSSLGQIRFDEDGPIGFGDFVMWFRIAERAAIGHIPQILWGLRQERNAQSSRTIVSMSYDYDVNLSRYCREYLQRWPRNLRLVRRWEGYIRRYLFWALAYEVGFYFRKNGLAWKRSPQTVFEILNYDLTPEMFSMTLERLERYRTGWLQHAAFFIMQILMKSKATRPLAWATIHPSLFRNLLGLRE